MAALLIVVAIVVVLVLYLVTAYNGLVRRRNRVESGWAQIDVQLQRRHDLIPNLVETVKGYATHERGVFEAVTQARANAVSATGVGNKAKAEQGVSGALFNLLAVAEQYPDLKANQNFLALQEELSGTEGRIAYARQFYNDEVQGYNTRLQSFPTSLVAARFGFAPREYFEADEAASSGPVSVQF
ncbi:MAG TPA: LemA family protein [Acidimicrobiales bacterium]|nr:LemA family protein [Acidimicrobiales bacterium]